jgi:hypothetical protein
MGSTLSDERTQDEQDRNERRFKRRSCRINGEDCLSGWRSQPRVPQPPATIRVQPSASLLTGVRSPFTLNPTTSSLLSWVRSPFTLNPNTSSLLSWVRSPFTLNPTTSSLLSRVRSEFALSPSKNHQSPPQTQ